MYNNKNIHTRYMCGTAQLKSKKRYNAGSKESPTTFVSRHSEGRSIDSVIIMVAKQLKDLTTIHVHHSKVLVILTHLFHHIINKVTILVN